MSDEQVFDLLATHSGPVTPSAEFEDRLFAILQGGVAQRRATPGLVLPFAAALAAVALLGAAAIGAGLLTLPFIDREPTPPPSVPTTPTPTPGPSAPSSAESTGRMLGMHVGHTANLLADGRVLVAGGWDDYRPEVYDPALGTWTATAPMVEIRDAHTATVLLDGTVLAAGGAATDMRPAHQSAEVYDPVTDTWTATETMTASRAHHTATLLTDGRVLVAGGSRQLTGGTPEASVELYDPALGQWTALADMNVARSHHTATLLESGMVLVAGGSAESSSTELYDPVRGTWTATGNMAARRSSHSSVRLADGRVLIVGGAFLQPGTSSTESSFAEVYDPETGSWARAGRWSGLGEPAVALLPSGRILVSDRDGARFYDPGDGVWSEAPGLGGSWLSSATLLPDGTVLIVGGWDGQDRGPSRFERWDVSETPVSGATAPSTRPEVVPLQDLPTGDCAIVVKHVHRSQDMQPELATILSAPPDRAPYELVMATNPGGSEAASVSVFGEGWAPEVHIVEIAPDGTSHTSTNANRPRFNQSWTKTFTEAGTYVIRLSSGSNDCAATLVFKVSEAP